MCSPAYRDALPLAKLTVYIPSRAPKETHMMISRGCQGVPVCENDDDEEDEEPAVIREPDEC